MSSPLMELRRLLEAKRAPESGVVSQVKAGVLVIATFKGVVEIRQTDATAYAVGDEVLFKDGVVRGKLKSLSSVLTYNV